MNKKIVLTEKQTKAIANEIYGDIKNYRNNNIDRYVPWLINEARKAEGKEPYEITPPLKCDPIDCEQCHICFSDFPWL